MSTRFDSTRRGFLKGATAALAGLFVVSNPQLRAADAASLEGALKAVEAGPLLVPSKPMLLEARTVPEKVTHAGEAFVHEINMNYNAAPVWSWERDYPDYISGPAEMDLRLKVIPKAGRFLEIQPGDAVRLFVVKRHD